VAQLENFRLKVFRTVAESLSFRKAAERLFLTQPAVTLQIKALEDELGVRLFDRTNQVSLTPQGSILLRYAQKMAALVSETEQALAAAQLFAFPFPFFAQVDWRESLPWEFPPLSPSMCCRGSSVRSLANIRGFSLRFTAATLRKS
jgi:DNA-binding transcriptional ArsR family regulator